MNVDERIQSAGSRLASTPVAVPDLERLMRRRSQRVRASAVVGSVAVISLGVVVLVGHDNPAVPSLMHGRRKPELIPHAEQEFPVDERNDVGRRALGQHDLVHRPQTSTFRQIETIVVVAPIQMKRQLDNPFDRTRRPLPLSGRCARSPSGRRPWITSRRCHLRNATSRHQTYPPTKPGVAP